MTDSSNTSSSHESSSSNGSLIKAGVSFNTKQIDMDSQSLLLPDINLSNINHEIDILNVTLDINDVIPIVKEPTENGNGNFVAEGINNLKDYLMLSIDKLYDTIDFLKQEIEEKNLLIRALIV